MPLSDPEICQVVTTIDSREAAETLARSAVEARLAACAQVGEPVFSAYWWQETLETAREWPVTFKTTITRYADLEAHIRSRHAYEVPEVVCLPVIAGSAPYLEWVRASTA
jgi:periplasmic divalent cation tolerance protein